MTIEIPGCKNLSLSTLLLDYNGSIATDGSIPDAVKSRFQQLAEQFKIIVLTADTHGTAGMQCTGLPLELCTFPTGNAADYKLEVLNREGGNTCVCSALLQESDICVTSIEDGLDLLLNPKRIIADLRG